MNLFSTCSELRTLHVRVGILFFWLVTALGCPGADSSDLRARFERAANLRRSTENKVYRDRVEPQWLAGNTQFWYRVKTGADTHEFKLVDAARGERKPAFDHARMAEALTEVGVSAAADRLPLERLDLNLSERVAVFRAGGKGWKCSLTDYRLVEDKAALAAETLNGIPLDQAPRASRRTGPETTLTFANTTQVEVRLYWLDPQGERHEYGKLGAGESREQHTFAGHIWLITDAAGKTLAVFEAEEKPARAVISNSTSRIESTRPRGERTARSSGRQSDRRSPDGKWETFVKENDLWLRSTSDGQEMRLSTNGTAEDSYNERAYWAPDSRKLVVMRTRKGDGRKVYLIESSPRDQLQPKLHSFDYDKPGDRIQVNIPCLFDVEKKGPITLASNLFPEPWSITNVRWAPDSSRFTFLYNQRGHQVLRLVAVSAATGETRAMIEERSDTFINYSGNMFLEHLPDTGETIWMSERDGWCHLYLYEDASGEVKHQITRGEWVVRGVERVDREQRQIWFRAGGIRPGQDPYYIHYARVNFDGSGLVVLTEGDGTHAIQFSPDRKYFVDTYSRVDLPPVNELRRTEDGKLVCELEQADATALFSAGWRAPERFVARGRDGRTDIYGIIVRPQQLDPAKRYPVVENIYAGPQGAFVPKGFSVNNRMHELAELGFILVQMDGMGTAHRSKAFHDVCWRNLGDAGFPDRKLWIKAAAALYPYMDLKRVGIYGTSAGGQSAVGGLLMHNEFYHVGVADCGCHDNRMDKIWWNEQWMGWPIGPHYAEQSNVTLADQLKGKLLLMVGELDRNVDPASTMQVVNALIKADKDFDLLVVPGAGHGVAGSRYGRRRLEDFFVRHLLGEDPAPARMKHEPPEIAVGPVPEEMRKEHRLDDFYQKHTIASGIPVLGSTNVSDVTLREAAWILDHLLAGREDIARALNRNKLRVTVMAWNEFTTMVPEHRNLSPAVFWDRRARGLGASRRNPVVSCAEENLLGMAGDPYSTENILIHEFAHGMHGLALNEVIPDFNKRLEAAFKKAKAAGKWQGTYAGTNPGEYWAEAVQSWFDNNRENDSLHNHVNTRAELVEYDPELAGLCGEVFGEPEWRYRKPAARAAEDRKHFAGYDAGQAPRFRWREYPMSEKPQVLIQTALGDIEVELAPQAAPITVSNFLHYALAGLYADGAFFRSTNPDNQPTNDVKIQVVQARADLSRTNEFLPSIPLERTRDTGLKHEAGTISMARLGADTAQHSFFFCLQEEPELNFGGKRNPDGQGFAAFGKVTKGMDVLKAIHSQPVDGQLLRTPVLIQRAIRVH